MDQSNVQFNEEIERYLNGLNINREEFTSQEKFVLKKIMQEFERTGKSNLLNSLYMQDYDEIPVSIERYLTDPEYAGNTTDQGKGIWPFWRGVLSKIFSPQFQYMKVIFGGSIGTGKSSIACIGISYIIYKLLCLKNPAEYYEVMKGSKPGIALFNITLDKGFGVAFHKINSICKNSPWFLRNGDLSGSRTNEVYLPGKGVTIGVGSMAEHFIGLDIFCLDGDTIIKTDKGDFKLSYLQGKKFKVFTYSNGHVELSEETTAIKTKEVQELYEIELQDGSIFRCTGEHRFMLTDGSYKFAKELTEDDDIMYIQN